MHDNDTTYHIPVLLRESVDGLDIRPGGIYIDVTFGGGGHTREILRRMDTTCHLYSFDQDADAQANAADLADDTRFTFVRSNFRYLKQWMRYYGEESVDGILADLGVSSHHFDDEQRGFSFRHDAPLDMRMNRQSAMSAMQVVNEYDEQQIADILYLYGELRQARRMAAAIVKARAKQSIKTTGALAEALSACLAHDREKKDLARVFQAIRIEVNHEMEALSEMLKGATDLLAEGGRLSVITYHSLEDRMVKNIIKAGNIEGKVESDFYGHKHTPLTAIGKPITPDANEIERNPRSRSAKLRIAERHEERQ